MRRLFYCLLVPLSLLAADDQEKLREAQHPAHAAPPAREPARPQAPPPRPQAAPHAPPAPHPQAAPKAPPAPAAPHPGIAPAPQAQAPKGPMRFFGRTPSMSRAAPAPKQGAAPAAKPNPQDLRTFVHERLRSQPKIPQGTTTASKQFHGARRGAATQQTNQQIARNHPGFKNWFNKGFFDSHHHHPNYFRSDIDWWRGPNWIVINNWLGYGWDYPYYYDYGDSTYYPDYEYAAPAPQPSNLVVAADWMPLGVFALSQTPEQSADAYLFFQLAVSKDGAIGGTYYNASTDQTADVTGVVDRDTQEAAFQFSGEDAPLIHVGLYNLQQDQTPVVIDFPEGVRQIWTFTKVNP